MPTVADRVAQTVTRLYLEPEVEPLFHPDSYGYRPGRSALEAVGRCRERCWRYDWVIDLDLRAFFDSLDHSLVLRAVAHHTDLRWILLYVERWLKAPLQHRGRHPSKQGIAAALRVRRSRPCWQTSSCTTRSICGWPGSSRPSRSSATRTMRSCTAKASSKRASCSTRSPSGWRRSVWSSIWTRRASCTARTANRKGSHEHERFTFLGYTFRPRLATEPKRRVLRQLLPGGRGRRRQGDRAHDQTLAAALVERAHPRRPRTRRSTRSCGAGSTTTAASTGRG